MSSGIDNLLLNWNKDMKGHGHGLSGDFHTSQGAFTQSVLRGVIRRRLGYVINKKYFFIKKTTILRRVIRRGVNTTSVCA